MANPIDIVTGAPGAPARAEAAGAVPARDREAERAKLKELAREFEAMLMNQMLSDWRRSLTSDDEESPDGMGAMTDMVGTEFGRALSRSGGFGIADVLVRAFERRQGQDSPAGPLAPITSQSVNGQALDGRLARLALTTPQLPLPPVERAAAQASAATVTSGFGWRPDPFSGQVKFHAGVDIRMAYGQEVSTAAGGRVAFAGEQSGYGLTVVIDHADGLQTRYAHLSSAAVQVGDLVAPGQVVARSGNSGRSTGPHLHLELLSKGRAIDPSGLLKGAESSADWKTYRSTLSRSTEEPARGDQE